MAPPGNTIKFVDQIVSTPRPGDSFHYYSWTRFLLGRYDVLHVHWPEHLIRSRYRALATVKRAALRLLLARLRLFSVAVVRTVHNLEPHAPVNDEEKRLLDLLDRRTDAYVVLNPTTPTPADRPRYLIPHGHYLGKIGDAGVTSRLERTTSFIHVGRIEPYKGVDQLLSSFAKLNVPDASLRIVGQPTRALRLTIEGAESEDRRVSSRLGFVNDADLADEILRSELVVLPYRQLHNSGILWVALSLGRPVLVPDNAATRAVEHEVGADWVFRMQTSLTADVLRASLDWARSRPGESPPRFVARDWPSIASRHHDMYAATLAGKRAERLRNERPM
ncbi:glycosyltransferase [Agromyces salentinus]